MLQSSKQDGYQSQLVEIIMVLCKDDKLVITQNLQHFAVEWYHHYLQLLDNNVQWSCTTEPLDHVND